MKTKTYKNGKRKGQTKRQISLPRKGCHVSGFVSQVKATNVPLFHFDPKS